MKKKELIGMKFNCWTIIGECESIIRIKKNGNRNDIRVLKCKCDCGTIKDVRHSNVVNGDSKSCGCIQKEKARKSIYELHKTQKGEGNPNWKGGISYHNKKILSGIRNSYPHREWSKLVKKRDLWRCVICNSGKQLNSHHLYNFTNEEKRFEIGNGITLCRLCHNSFHKKYGRFNNTPEQFYEFNKQNYAYKKST